MTKKSTAASTPAVPGAKAKKARVPIPFCVDDKSTDPPTQIIVRALSQSGAIARLSEPRYSARAVSANECVDLMAAGVKVLADPAPVQQAGQENSA